MKFRGKWIVIGSILFAAALMAGCASLQQPVQAAAQSGQSQRIEEEQSGQQQPVQKLAPPARPVEPESASEEPRVLPDDDQGPALPAGDPQESQDTPTAYPDEPENTRTEDPTPLPSPTPLPDVANILPPEQWKEWPVMPVVSAEMRAVYQRGLKQGNNPRAFSVLGDCQSQPEVFMGVFDSDPEVIAALPESLRETVNHFAGSFDRYSPTVKDGTTEGALLWAEWNDNKEKKCTHGETPLDCELRVHRPSIVFIHIGTHWEARNYRYLKEIIERVLDHGAVPVMVTKADNRELDERVNQNIAILAAEYNLPMWNFWASVQHLPDNGMKRNSDMYLSDAGMEIHRAGALDALDAVWRAVR